MNVKSNHCDICGQDCITKGALKMHRTIKHPMANIQKPVEETYTRGELAGASVDADLELETEEKPVTLNTREVYNEINTGAIAPVQDEATALISEAIRNKVDVGTMERLLAMRNQLKAEKAKEAFDRALAAFQADCPIIKKTKSVNFGTTHYSYAPLESIVDQVKHLLSQNGFSYTFDSEKTENSLTMFCKVKHTGGHMEVSKFTIAVDSGSKMNISQKDGSASTYGKRYAFMNALGILTGDEDNDASSPIVVPQKASYQYYRENPKEYQQKLEEIKRSEEVLITSDQDVKIRQLMVKKGKYMDDVEGFITQWSETNGRTKTKLKELTEGEADNLIKKMEQLPDKK